MSEPDPPPPKPRRRRRRRVAILVVFGILGLLLIGGLVVRYGANTAIGRSIITERLDGLKVGRFGKLHIEGLSGDFWGDVRVSRMAIIDPQGVWLDASNLQFQWRPLDLIQRRVHLTEISARQVQLIRKPVLGPQGPRGRQPVAVTIERISFHLDTLPAASEAPGSFDIGAAIDSERNGALSGALNANSRVHKGDAVSASFDFGVRQRLAFNARAREGQGGAIGGLLGLPTDRAFSLDASAGGDNGDGWLHVRAISGDQSIAQADGTWTKQGGQGAGRLSLAASRLSAPLMHALGPQVTFSAAGRPAGGGLYGAALFAHADNAAVRAVGLVDATTMRSPTGLTLQGQINDLRRVVAAPAMGRATLTGRLVGGWADARISGTASVEQLSLGGYGLARVAGPIDLTHEHNSWRLRLDAGGEGGRGAGLLAALIGGRPHATLEATRLDDGRLLVQSLKVAGSGLSLDASGERGLLGDLSFKGDLRISNLAAAHAGASGLIDAQWSGKEPKGARAWTINLNAKGEKFSSGFSELDRLIGPSPRLTGDVTYVDGAFLIGKAELAGQASDLRAAGPIGKDGGLKLALSWTANGPFAVGPLDIAGSAKGTGAMTGTLIDPRADLIADFDEIDLPNLALKPAHAVLSFVRDDGGLHGDLALTAASDYGPAHAKADFRFIPSGVALTGIDAAGGGVTVLGDLTLTRSTPSVADLTLTASPGAFLAQGHADALLKIVDAPGGPMVNLALKASDASLRNSNVVLTSADISANGPLSQAPYKISGALVWAGTPIRLNGGGVASQRDAGYAFSFEGTGRLRQADFHTITPVLLTVGGQNQSLKASLSLGAGQMDVDAQQIGRQIAVTAKLAGVNIAALDNDFAGRVDAELSMTGHDQTVSGTLDARLADARLRDAQAKLALSGELKANLAGDRMDIVANAQNQAGGHANVSLALPTVSSVSPFRVAIAESQPVTGRFDVEGEIEPIWQLLFGGERTLGGRVSAHGDIGGTLNDPRVSGHASLADGRLEDASTGLKLRNVVADADLAQDIIAVHSFTASDSKSGTVSGQGDVNLSKGGESTLTLNLHAFQFLDNETASATATGAVVIARDAAGKARLSGQLNINHAEISTRTSRAPPGVVHMDVVERNRPPGLDSGLQVQTVDRSFAVALDVTLRSSGGVFVRGLGLNAEMSLDASVTGDTNHPVLEGSANVVRGDYQLAGQRFLIDTRSYVSLATSPADIRLDITATREDPTLTAIVKIGGSAAKPEITLSSSPVLPPDEVLSQVLFGRSAAQLSPVEAAQLAAAVTTLATGGGFDVMGGLQNLARLDRIALGGDGASGVTVSGGKYIGKHVYLELTGGGRQGPSAQVEVRAGHGLSVVSQVGGQPGAKLGISWRHDYGAPSRAAATKH